MKIEQCSTESPLSQERIKKEIKDFLESNENEYRTYPNLWDSMKTKLRGKSIVLSAHIKKVEKSCTSKIYNTPGSSKTKRSKLTQDKSTIGNHKIDG